jgi:hypothetical protein
MMTESDATMRWEDDGGPVTSLCARIVTNSTKKRYLFGPKNEGVQPVTDSRSPHYVEGSETSPWAGGATHFASASHLNDILSAGENQLRMIFILD